MSYKYKFLYAFTVVLSLVITMAGSVFAASVSIGSVKVNHEEKLVKIEGTVDDGAGSRVTLKVIKPNSDVEEFFGQTVSEADGNFKFEFKIGSDAVEDAQYSVFVYSDNAVKKAISGFKYFNERAISNALALLNSASESTIGSVISEKNEIFGLSIGIGSDFYELDRKQPVYDELANLQFSDLDALRTAFDEAVSTQKQIEYVEEQKRAALASVNNALASEMENVFPNAAQILGIKTDTDTISKLSSYKDAIYSALAANNFSSEQELKDFYDRLIVAQAFLNANREIVANVINDYNNVLGFKDNYDYSQMTESEQAEVRKRMVGISFSGMDLTTKSGISAAVLHIKNSFSSAVAAQKQAIGAVRPGNPGGGSSGGGGSSAGVIMFPQGSGNTGNGTDSASVFVDIDNVSWAKEGILYLADKNIIAGYGDGTFKPNENVTREQFVKMLVAAFELPYNPKEINFADVSKDVWYYEYVSSGVGCGIIKGVSETKFGTGDEITRQDMAVMAYRTMNYLGVEIPKVSEFAEFADNSMVAGYAAEAVMAMQGGNIINGMENNQFAPQVKCTRAMAAKVIYELHKLAD